MNRSQRNAVSLMLVAGGWLSGCHSAPTHMFSLEPIAPSAMRSHSSRAASEDPGASGDYAAPPNDYPAPSGEYHGPALRVDSVTVPPAYDRLELVTTPRPAELKVQDLDEWSAPLVDEARQTLSADLVARLPPGRVIFPHLMKPAGALGLSVDVLEFHADGAGASMQVSWVIDGTAGNQFSAGSTATLRTKAPCESPPAVVAAWSQLLAQLADRIVDSLTR